MPDERRVALINEPRESTAGLKMLEIAQIKLQGIENKLTHTPMDRETYLQAFGRAAVLRELLEEQTSIYRRFFET